MVSRRSTGPLRKIMPAVAVGLVALGIAGCSSGQVTQTDTIEPAVNGNQGNVGSIALRDGVVAYPESGGYDAGGDAPLTLAIVNVGGTDDELTSVTSPAAATVELIGRGTLPARSGLTVVVPASSGSSSSAEPTGSASSSTGGIASGEPDPSGGSGIASGEPAPTASPSVTPTDVAPEDVGTMSIVLTDLTKDLPIGRNVPITFVFAGAGQITIIVPIDSPETGRAEPESLPE